MCEWVNVSFDTVLGPLYPNIGVCGDHFGGACELVSIDRKDFSASIDTA